MIPFFSSPKKDEADKRAEEEYDRSCKIDDRIALIAMWVIAVMCFVAGLFLHYSR